MNYAFPLTTPLSVRFGIVGGGTMGSGIALAALRAGIPVTLYEANPTTRATARDYLHTQLTRKNQAAALNFLTLAENLQDLSGCNLVLEAIYEDLAAKQELFKQLEEICPPPAILATNTSTLSVTAIAAALQQPQRAAGMHFFNPAAVLPLVEIVSGAQTSAQTADTLTQIATMMGKTPVSVRDLPGFIVNRVARPFYGEALRLLGESTADHVTIDQIITLGGGFKMGPFALMDLIGIDINFAAMNSMYEQTWGEPRYRPHAIQRQMVQQGALGRKTQRGFYTYKDDAPPQAPALPKATPISGIVAFPADNAPPELSTRLQNSGATLINRSTSSHIPQAVLLNARTDNGLMSHVIEWDSATPPDTLLLVQATDIALSQIAAWMQHPQRLVGFDNLFLAGAQAVTMMAGEFTAEPARRAAETLIRNLGWLPLWVRESPALVLPRVVAMLINEAAFAVLEGVAAPDEIDLAMQLGVNYPKGLLAWGRELGFARVTAILDLLWREYHEERYRACRLLRQWARAE